MTSDGVGNTIWVQRWLLFASLLCFPMALCTA